MAHERQLEVNKRVAGLADFQIQMQATGGQAKTSNLALYILQPEAFLQFLHQFGQRKKLVEQDEIEVQKLLEGGSGDVDLAFVPLFAFIVPSFHHMSLTALLHVWKLSCLLVTSMQVLHPLTVASWLRPNLRLFFRCVLFAFFQQPFGTGNPPRVSFVGPLLPLGRS